MKIHGLLLLLAPSLFPQNSDVVISQIYGGGGNAGATLRNDFIELFNRGSASVNVNGWSVQYAAAAGSNWQVTALSGVISPGRYYLVRQAAGTGGTQDLPSPDASGEIAMSATSAKVALVRNATPLEGNSPSSAAIADLVGYGTADFFRGTPVRALTNTTAALRRNRGCTDTSNNGADFDVGSPIPRNSASPLVNCLEAPPAAIPTTISRIQGRGNTSPLVGQRVETTGIVTARRSNGFYIQSAPADDDGDQETSEGLLIFTSSAPPAEAEVGNLVRVTGMVTGFRPAADPESPTLTEITSPAVELISTGHALPPPILLTTEHLAPGGGPDLLERYEGMRVEAGVLRVIAPTGGAIDEANARGSTNGIFFAVLEGAARPHREPGIRFDGNPERLRIDASGLRLRVQAGARVRSVRGPLDYGFRTYTILAEAGMTVEGGNRAAAVLAPEPEEFSAASINLRRLFDTADDPSTADPVLTPEAFERRLRKIALAIRDTLRLPDLIAVQEVENLPTLQALAARLGPSYRAFLEEGNDPGGIDVGFLVNTARITPVSVTQEEKSATYRTPSGATQILHDRPPLVLRASIGSFRFTAMNLHPRSLIGIETPEVQAKRQAQAEAIARLAGAVEEPLVVLCDCNAFPFPDGYVDVMGIIGAGRLRNLTTLVPRDQGFTFLQDGNAQTLDHVLVSDAMHRRITRFQVAHVNADSPVDLFGDDSRAERFSDHDVPVVHFRPEPPSLRAFGVVDAASFLGGALSPGQIVTVFVGGVGPPQLVTAQLTADQTAVTRELAGTRVLVDGTPAPVLFTRSDMVAAILPFSVGSTARLRMEFNGRSTNEVAIPVSASAPALFAGTPGSLARGSIAVFFATGLGATTPASLEGALATAPLPSPVLPVSMTIGGFPAEIVFGGAAPGQVAGLFQINARVSDRAAVGPAEVILTAGEQSSDPLLVVVE